MAKKRRRRKASLLTKGINVGVLALAFSPILRRLMNPTASLADDLADLYSAGLTRGGFSQPKAMEAYGPILAAIVLKKAISFVRKSARV